jgi:two-component system, OmpR family, response regulator AdeR
MREVPTVLIVEDTIELAEVIEATLERMGLETTHETHGNTAIAKFNELDPDIVLLDISLPDTTGWKILEVIKDRFEVTGQMPVVIIITAFDDPANRLVGKLQGVYSYLIKPFTADEIERIVEGAINSSLI